MFMPGILSAAVARLMDSAALVPLCYVDLQLSILRAPMISAVNVRHQFSKCLHQERMVTNTVEWFSHTMCKAQEHRITMYQSQAA